MNNKTEGHHGFIIAVTLYIFAVLLFCFGRYIQSNSYDLAQHFLLVDELMKHGAVLPGDIESMATYPTGSHWIAAIVGWFTGCSGLVAITLVTIASIYFSYVLILRLVGVSSPVRMVLFAGAFAVLICSRSLIGWEVVLNYFYSQIVTDVLYFGMLLWISREPRPWRQVVMLLVVCWFAMWVHSLVPLHLLATGCVLLAFQTLSAWKRRESFRSLLLALFVLIAGSVVIAARNPAFREMRRISANDGWLTFGYENVLAVAILCGLIGIWNLSRRWRDHGEYIDTVLGSALVAAVCLLLMQFAVLKMQGDGSAYAVKKHMFLIVTLAMMNGARAIAALFPVGKWRLNDGVTGAIGAGIASWIVLSNFTTPVAPIVRALSFADNAVRYQLPEFRPGDFVADDDALPVMGNWMVSLGPFQHSFDTRAHSWQNGVPIKDGAKYVMLRRSASIDSRCPQHVIETSEYVIVSPACLLTYNLGSTLSFSTGGNGWNYASTGWSGPEPWGSWTLGDGGVLNMSLRDPASGPLTLTADGMVYVNPKHPAQQINVIVNGANIGSWTYKLDAPAGQRSIQIPESIARTGKLRIMLRPVDPVSPLGLGNSEDGRVLGLGVKSVTLKAD